MHSWIIYRNGDPERVVVKLYCPEYVALSLNYNLENADAYGNSYTLRQLD